MPISKQVLADRAMALAKKERSFFMADLNRKNINARIAGRPEISVEEMNKLADEYQEKILRIQLKKFGIAVKKVDDDARSD